MARTRQPSKHAQGAEEALAFKLHAAMLHMMRRVRREDDAFGLSAPRMSALSTVAFGQTRTIGEMASMEQVSPPTMTRLVDALQENGLVLREPDPADRRTVRVRATALGRRTIEQGRRRRVAFLAAKLQTLPTESLRALDVASDAILRIYDETR
jgi:DNA-binding MarR family transcriptional regulator